MLTRRLALFGALFAPAIIRAPTNLMRISAPRLPSIIIGGKPLVYIGNKTWMATGSLTVMPADMTTLAAAAHRIEGRSLPFLASFSGRPQPMLAGNMLTITGPGA